MKKLLITILLSFLITKLFAPAYESLPVLKAEGVRDETLLRAIIHVESRGNPSAINWHEQALGLLQIRPIMLREVNRIAGYEKYTAKDCLDSLKSIQMYWLVQSFHNPSGSLKRGAIVWNGKSKNNLYWKEIQKYI